MQLRPLWGVSGQFASSLVFGIAALPMLSLLEDDEAPAHIRATEHVFALDAVD